MSITDLGAPVDTLASRLSQITSSSPWLDPTASAALASSPTPTSGLSGALDSLKQAVANTWDGLTHITADPVLQQAPTATSAFIRYLTGTIGPLPVADSDLIHMQTQLQKAGYGHDLNVNGVWSQDWNSAYQTYAHAAVQDALAGNKPGSVSSGGLLHHILSSITPSGIGSALWGTIKSIPGDLQQLGTDIGGTAAQAYHGAGQIITDPGSLFQQGGSVGQATKEHRAAGQAATNQALGGNLTYTQALQRAGTSADLANQINNVGTLLLLTGGAGGVTALRTLGRQEIDQGLFTRLSTAAATRGPGVVARTLLTAPAKRAMIGGALGGATGAVQSVATGSDLGNSIAGGAVLGAGAGLAAPVAGKIAGKTVGKDTFEFPTHAVTNMPVLGRVGPVLGKLLPEIGADGKLVEGGAPGAYYALRTKLATPYQFGAVRLAMGAVSEAQAFSLKAHAVGYLESRFGPDAGAIQQAMDSSHPLDTINQSLRAATGQLTGGAFQADLDSLVYLMGRGSTSSIVKRDVTAVHDNFIGAMSDNGLLRQFENGSGKSYATHIADFDNDPNLFHTFLNQKIYETAVWHAAERAVENAGHNASQLMDAHGVTKGQWAWSELVRAEAAAIWHNPASRDAAVQALAAPNHQYLTDAIRQQMTSNLGTGEAFLANSGAAYTRAGNHVRQLLSTPGVGDHLLTPHDVAYQATTDRTKSLTELFSPRYFSTGDIRPGVIGLMRDDGMTRQEGLRRFQQLKTEHDLDPAGLTGDWYRSIYTDLHDQFNLDSRALTVFADSPEKLLNLYHDKVSHLASEVFPDPAAPRSVLDRIQGIKAEGYRLVAGEDIGHAFDPTLPSLEDLGAATTRLRRNLERVGMGTDLVSRTSMTVDRKYRITSAIARDVFESGKYPLPAYATPQTIVRVLSDPESLPKTLGPVRNALMDLFARAHKATTDALVDTGQADNTDQALAILKQQLAANGGLSRVSLADFQKILGRPVTFDAGGLPQFADKAGVDTVPYMAQDTIKAVYKAVQKGYAQTPVNMVGAGKIEALAKYLPFKLAGKVAPNSEVALHVANLPTNLLRLRDEFRFNLSPMFDARRVVKTNVKMAADGIQPTLTPVKALRASGAWDSAHTLLDHLTGRDRFTHLDDADSWLDAHGVFGLYNPRHYEAYYVAQKKAQGATDQQIKDGLVRVFQYGRDGAEGRTAMERSMNTVFFPFSFEKTVMRNIGSYLLDRPAQMLILSNSLDAYHDFSAHHADNPLALSWINTHLPLLQEAERLNTFTHGFSLGEFGGVNAPLFAAAAHPTRTSSAVLNAFLPQSWKPGSDTTKLMSRFIPAVTDLQRIINEGTDQGRITRTALSNGIRTLYGDDGTGILNSQPVAESANQQVTDALNLRRQLIDAFGQVLAYNYGKNETQQYTFGSGPGIPEGYRNAPITKQNISNIIALKYPAFDPTRGATIAIGNKQKFSIMLRELQAKHDPRYEQYKDFYAKANTAIGHLNRDDYTLAQDKQVDDVFRARAIQLARTDPQFLKLYNQLFRSAFGPIEAIR